MKTFITALLVAALTSLAVAGTPWKVDKSHSNIGFTVKHMVVSDVSGNFKDYEITFTSDKEDYSDAAVEAVIKAASINTGNERRDGHLKSDDFFNAEKFPTITFKSTSFEKTGDKQYKITGDLTIRDVTKKVTFDAVYNGSVKAPWGVIHSWKATTSINRFDYNLKWNKAIEAGGSLIVSENVAITLNFELSK